MDWDEVVKNMDAKGPISAEMFRSNYLTEETIGIVPKNMYRESNKPYSNSSIEWLELVTFQRKSNIRHALHNVGEKVIFHPS